MDLVVPVGRGTRKNIDTRDRNRDEVPGQERCSWGIDSVTFVLFRIWLELGK